MSYEVGSPGESGEAIVWESQHEKALKLFAYIWHVMDMNAVVDRTIIAAPELPSTANVDLRLYRKSFRENGEDKICGGVCLFPSGDPKSPSRIDVEVYQTFGTIPLPTNKFTTEQVDLVIEWLDLLELERDLGNLPDLSPDLTHIVEAEKL